MKRYYLAGGGTGGHIYPAIAVAQQLRKIDPAVQITFFCSERPIDTRILSNSGFEYVTLPMRPFSFHPAKLIKFLKAFALSRKIVTDTISTDDSSMLVGFGGFASVVPILSAKKLQIPIAIVNVDAVPGKANRLLARFAMQIFVQFDYTTKYFAKSKVQAPGCPLRDNFNTAQRNDVLANLELNVKKRTLLITGASGGAVNVNTVIGFLLDKLNGFADRWQIIHICGISNLETVQTFYKKARIDYRIFGFRDDMPALLTAADLILGRAGGLSVAEYAASATPSICLPYPYHRDNHQKLNAQQLAEAGACKIVTDFCDTEKTAQALWPVISELMKSPEQLDIMKTGCKKVGRMDAAEKIAKAL